MIRLLRFRVCANAKHLLFVVFCGNLAHEVLALQFNFKLQMQKQMQQLGSVEVRDIVEESPTKFVTDFQRCTKIYSDGVKLA
jgi:hypothetical protein